MVKKGAPPETLAEFVSRVMFEKRLTAAAVEERSKRGNKEGITRAYVSQIKNGRSLNPTKDKLRALADGLGISSTEIFSIAQGSPVKAESDEEVAALFYRRFAEKYPRLGETQKQEIRRLLEIVDREIDRLEDAQ